MYYSYWEPLRFENDIVFKEQQIVIPKSFQKSIIVLYDHDGIASIIRRAWDTVFWPGMNNVIRQRVLPCDACNIYLIRQQKEPIMQTEIPTRPWQHVTIDLLTFNKVDYLIITEYFSYDFQLENLGVA